MPTCKVCQTFYVRPQTFDSLFTNKQECLICETYAHVSLNDEVIPIDYNVIEYYTFNHSEHPAFTKKIFERMHLSPQEPMVFYEDTWVEDPVVFHLMASLCAPFRLFSYHRAIRVLEKVFSESV